jgi:hypothetical protein
MVDYTPFLFRAIATLNPNTSESRDVLYHRARRALIDKLRASDPTLSSTDLRAESAALEAAILLVETDAVRRAAARRPTQYESHDPAVEEYRDRPPLRDRRRSLNIVVGAFCALVIALICAGVVHSLWPRIASSTRAMLGSGPGSRIDQQPAINASYVYLRQPVYYRTSHPVGTIVIDKSQNFLYVVRPNLSALRYGIGVGPECTASAGLYQIVRKEEWPGWKPLQQSADTDNDRIKNPLGARALYFNEEYRIHGSNVSVTAGQRLPQGCIRLVNDDVIYLYDRTSLKNRVVVSN